MTASNTARPGATVVPSARAERRRIVPDDRTGVLLYGAVIAVLGAVLIGIVIVA